MSQTATEKEPGAVAGSAGTGAANPENPAHPVPPAHPAQPLTARRRSNFTLYLVLAVCIAPVIASYLLYYFFPPGGRTNFGDLILPPRPAPALALKSVDDVPVSFDGVKGQWLLLQVDGGVCAADCDAKLHTLRQLRTMTGKDRTRVERVWLVGDEAPITQSMLVTYEGTIAMRAGRQALEGWLPVPAGTRLEDFFFVVDPLGNLMMRFPKDGDPRKMHKDVARLLKASRIG